MKWKALMTAVVVAVAVFSLGANNGCEGSRYKGQGETQKKEAQLTENNQARLIKACPPPALKFSLERQNLKTRLERFNNPEKISYIYLIDYGKVMSFFTIKGKVSSVNSKLTTGEQIVDDPYRVGGAVVESPQLDGSYGTNGDAIFFFTSEGVYVEWNKGYILCDEPLKLSTPPALVRQVD